jgi:hypothetical protein
VSEQQSIEGAEVPVWGVGAISKVIGRTERATYHLLEKGAVAGSQRVGGRWSLLPSIFRASFQNGIAA